MTTTPNTMSTHDTAAQAYARHAKRIASILGWVDDELAANAARQSAAPRNWGFVGTLAEMETLLKRALGHLSGMEPGRVDDALADLAGKDA